MADEIRVTVVATGIGTEKRPDITLVAGSKPAVVSSPQPASSAVKVEDKAASKLHENVEAKQQPSTAATLFF